MLEKNLGLHPAVSILVEQNDGSLTVFTGRKVGSFEGKTRLQVDHEIPIGSREPRLYGSSLTIMLGDTKQTV